ncbi:MAG: TlpA family protein disulfide reductase [Bacteroidetes bacterium]|nr:TlpA family protein disulfide reductase [Bacteroidota bacterium]
MKSIPKSALFILFLVGMYFFGGFDLAASLTQRAALHSGLMNASTETEGHEAFDYDFVIKDLDGNKADFNNYKGKVVFLNLWATWCAPCRSEMPGIQKLYNEVDHEKIVFVMLSLDKDAQVEKVKKFIKNQSYSFPIFMPSGYLSEQLQVPSIPTTFVIGKDGIVAMKEIGMKNYDTPKFKKFLNELAK